MAEPFKFCVFQTSTNTDKVVADDFTKTVLVGNRSFYCGCTDLPDSTWFGKPVEEEEILSLFPDDMIKPLHENLTTGKYGSNNYRRTKRARGPFEKHGHLEPSDRSKSYYG
ncbi:hypothetical protein OJAV_G00236450 [Oryzias javanicus]|uniref:Uncharacterized protein n=1 Tax=Oryzias javanicus TaxID=123683 RepID=A0A437BY76_ORYJA|nr:hypothetical protein OJAV_G00236450 [Oryzias javanicus]